MSEVNDKERQREIKELEALFGNYELEDTAHIDEHPEQFMAQYLRALYGDYSFADTERILGRLERLAGPSFSRDFVDSLRYHDLDWGWNGSHPEPANEQDVKDSDWIRYNAVAILEINVETELPEDWDDLENDADDSTDE